MTLIHRSLVQEKEDVRQVRTEVDLCRHASIIELLGLLLRSFLRC